MKRFVTTLSAFFLVLGLGMVGVTAFEAHTINITGYVAQPDPGTCLLIIDEDFIDNNMDTIEEAAAMRIPQITSDHLVNDDTPFEPPLDPFAIPPLLNTTPPLRWNSSGFYPAGNNYFLPNEMVLLDTGQVDDEGIFSLPPDPPGIVYADMHLPAVGDYDDWIQKFARSHLTQEELDKIKGVKPLRNYDLRKLVHRECIGVVYDSDISINYVPNYGNLQGARYGLFGFKVHGVQLPGVLPEATSDTSLLSLWVEIKEVDPLGPVTVIQELVPQDQDADSVQITHAKIVGNQVQVFATSDRQDELDPPTLPPTLNVSIMTVPNVVADVHEGAPYPVDMDFISPSEGYKFVAELGVTPDFFTAAVGDTVTISSSQGGAYNVIILP